MRKRCTVSKTSTQTRNNPIHNIIRTHVHSNEVMNKFVHVLCFVCEPFTGRKFCLTKPDPTSNSNPNSYASLLNYCELNFGFVKCVR